MLPTDTDFYGITDQPYRGTSVSETARDLDLPLALADGVPAVDIAVKTAHAHEIEEAGGTARRLAREWERWGVTCRVSLEAPPSPEAKAESAHARALERIVLERVWIDRDLAVDRRQPQGFEHAESYSLHFGNGSVTVVAATHPGLERGAAALASSLRVGEDGALRASLQSGTDRPAIDVRFLGGWALWRTDQLREAIDLAWTCKANRVLYNGWGWIPGEELWKEDAYFVEYARERGIELVYELRRMSFGREYDIREPAARQAIVAAYRKAADRGFLSFGLLFDDVPWETAADECALATEIHRELKDHHGHHVEFFCCPQFYWYPGQMNAAWSGHGDAEESARQKDYLETYGRSLRGEIHLYIANFWGGHPEDYRDGLREKFSELVGRKPIFFDNQQINDYRLGALFPFPLAGRPKDFGDHVRGYYLNCARPLSAYAPAAATALAYAWNPATYEPERAMREALAWYYGPSRERVRCISEGVNRLRDLANEWADGTTTAADHYATIWRRVRRGDVDVKTIENWAEELREVRRYWMSALEASGTHDRLESRDGLLELITGTRRLEGDLAIFTEFLNASADPGLIPRFVRESARLAQVALDHVACLLPPAPGTVPLLASLEDEAPPALEPRDAQGWSWVEYFHRRTLKALREVRGEMLEELAREIGQTEISEDR